MGIYAHGKAEIIFSIIATHVFLSLSISYPALVFWKLINKSTTDTLALYPHLTCMVHSVFIRMLYEVGLKAPNSTLPFHVICLLFSSYIVPLFQGIYFILFAVSCDNKKLKNKLLPISLLFLALAILLSYVLTSHNTNLRPVLGYLAVVSGAIMYTSPVTKIIRSRKEESVSGSLVWLCTGFFLNGLAWFIVALVVQKINVYIAVTNGIGMLLGLLQLGVVCELRRRYSSNSKFHVDARDYMEPLLD